MKILVSLIIIFSFSSCNNSSNQNNNSENKNIDLTFSIDISDLDIFIGGDDFKDERAKDLNRDGIELIKKGEIRKAEKKFIKAIRIEPTNPTILNNLGNIYRKIGTEKMAIEYYNEALKNSDSSYFNAAYNLGISYCSINQYNDSKQILEYIISKTTNETKIAIANYTLATVLVNMNKCYEAKIKFQSVQITLSEYSEYEPKLDSLERKIKNCVQQWL